MGKNYKLCGELGLGDPAQRDHYFMEKGDRKAYILLIEDDAILGESLREYLENQGFMVMWIGQNFEDLQKRVNFSCFDVVVLDLILPGISGEEILDVIRERAPDTPVLVLTAKSGLDSKRVCFVKGADDYLVKPFEIEELVLRLGVLIRRRKSSTFCLLEGFVIDRLRGIVLKDGKEFKLTPKAWSLLNYLIENRGRVVDKDEIIKVVWGGIHVTEENLRAYIKELRKLFPKSIETYKGRGYKLL